MSGREGGILPRTCWLLCLCLDLSMKSQFTYMLSMRVLCACVYIYMCVCAAVADVCAVRCGCHCELHIYFAFCSIYMKIILIMRLAFDTARATSVLSRLTRPWGGLAATRKWPQKSRNFRQPCLMCLID